MKVLVCDIFEDSKDNAQRFHCTGFRSVATAVYLNVDN